MDEEALEAENLNAILAGLRLLQAQYDRLPADIATILDNCGENEPLDEDAIDDLCERINIEGLTFGDGQ